MHCALCVIHKTELEQRLKAANDKVADNTISIDKAAAVGGKLGEHATNADDRLEATETVSSSPSLSLLPLPSLSLLHPPPHHSSLLASSLPLTIHPSFLPSCALSFPLCVRLYVCVSMCAPASLFLRVCLNSRAHCISTHMHGYVCMKIRTHARTHALTTGARACLQGIRVVIHRRVCICTGYQCSREPSGENCTARGQHVGVYATCNTEHNYYFAY